MTTSPEKIALVTLDYPPERGGVARYLGNLVQASSGLIDVFVNRTHQCSGPGHVQGAFLLHEGFVSWWPMVEFIRSLKKQYSSVLVSHALPVGTAAWLAYQAGGPSYAVVLHGLDLRLALTSKRKAWLLKRVLRGAHAIFANSAFVAAEILAFDDTLKPFVLTPGVEPIAYPSRDEARQALGLLEDEQIILGVGRLIPRKGFDHLIGAMRTLPETAKLVIIGDGYDQHRLDEAAKLVKNRVRFISHASDQERNRWYAASDIFALPVREDNEDVEGFGIVYLEAALAGLPCVAGKSGGAPEAVVDGETGLIVDSQSPDAIADALRKLLQDTELRRRFGHAGKARAQSAFRWDTRWEQLRKHLKREN